MPVDHSSYLMWLHAEIARAEARAGAMRAALAAFENTVRSDGATVTNAPPPQPSAEVPRSRSPRRSKYDAAIESFSRRAIPLSIDDMSSIMTRMGVAVDRNIIRSMIFTQKKHGRVVEQNGAYLWKPLPDEDSASPVLEVGT